MYRHGFFARASMAEFAPSTTWNKPLVSGAGLAYAATFLILAAIFLGSPNFRPASGPEARPLAGDFLQEWIGGYVVRSGDYTRFYDVAYAQALQHDAALVGFEWRESEYFPLVYPPFYYLLVSPFSLLPFHAAAILWAMLMVAALFAAWRLFCKSACVTAGEDACPTVWLLPAAVLFTPLIESLTTCQKGTVLLLILTATYYLLTSKRPYYAGLVFGLIAFKPQFAVPIAIAMLYKRQWWFVLGGLTTGSVLVAICLLMGLDVCRQYVAFSTHASEYLQNAGYDLTKSHAWYGFFTLLWGDGSWLVRPATILAGATTIALVALVLRGKLEPSSPRFAWQYSALIVATVLLSPHLYTYDLTVLLLPLGLVAVGQASSPAAEYPIPGRRGRLLHYPIWLAALLYCLAGLSPQIAGVTGVQLTVPLMLAFLASGGCKSPGLK